MLSNISPQQWIILGAFLAILLPIAAGIVKYSYLPTGLRSLFWFCVVGFVLDGIGRIFWLFSVSNLFMGHLSTLSEFILLASVYRISLRGFVHPLFIPVLMVLFAVLAIMNTLFLQNFEFNNSNIKIIESALLIGLALLFFFKLLREMVVTRLEKHPMFWVNCAVLVYFSSTLFIFISSNYLLLYSKELGIQVWFIHALFFILFYIILSISLWIVPRNSNSHG